MVALGLVGLCALLPRPAAAQRALDLQVGRWAVTGSDPTVYSAGLRRHIWGPLAYSLRGQAVVDRDSAGRSLYGFGPEIILFRGGRDRAGFTAYGLGGAGLALAVGEPNGLSATWSAGLGLEWKARSLVSANVEARRLVEDEALRGFWDLGAGDRRGWLLSLGFSIRWGGRRRGEARAPTPLRVADRHTDSPDGARHKGFVGAATPGLPGSIVQTALAVMGEPYRWGGTSTEEGFDCSGLVWYAYTSHGVQVPRVSRDQARAGRPVAAEVAALRPGDILLFADRPGAVTHVGLYVGDGQFIHATSSGGVRVGALDARADEYDRWWLARWVGARRVLE